MVDGEKGNGALIVVIDDDEAARHSIGQMLSLRGWTVEVFSSAEAALAWPGLRGARNWRRWKRR